MKSWNLNFLKPSGPLQACNGTALPFEEKELCVQLVTYKDCNKMHGQQNIKNPRTVCAMAVYNDVSPHKFRTLSCISSLYIAITSRLSAGRRGALCIVTPLTSADRSYMKSSFKIACLTAGTVPTGDVPQKIMNSGLVNRFALLNGEDLPDRHRHHRLTERNSGFSDSLSQSAIECVMGSRPPGPDAPRPFTSMPIGPSYSLTFLPTALTKVWTGVAQVCQITSGFSLPYSRHIYPLVLWPTTRSQTSKLYITERYAKCSSRSSHRVGRALPSQEL